MKQVGTQKWESECKKAVTFAENDMSAAALFDYAMRLKNIAYQMIVDAQKREEEEKAKSCTKENCDVKS